MKIEEVKTIFRIFEQSFPDFIASEEKARIWAVVLADVSFSDAKTATIEICRSDKKPPVPARLIEVIRTLKAELEEPPEMVWERIVNLAKKGDEGEWIFNNTENARVKKAIRSVGGFSRIRYADFDALPFVRRDFILAYKEFIGFEERQIADVQLKALVNNLAQAKLLK